MKIHYEGTYKELQIISSSFIQCSDLIVMETSWVREKNGVSNYYYLDVDVIVGDKNTKEESIYSKDEIYEREIAEIKYAPYFSDIAAAAEFWNIYLLAHEDNMTKEKILEELEDGRRRINNVKDKFEKYNPNGNERDIYYED